MHAYRKPGRLAGAPRHVTTWAAILALPLAAGIISCGSSSHGSSAGSCAARTPAAYLAGARVVLLGAMLPGRAVDLGGHRVLLSPARVQVIRYLKGSGPRVVSVVTGITSGNVVGEDGIEPVAGQHWKIYTQSQRMPYQTSICQGTEPAQDAVTWGPNPHSQTARLWEAFPGHMGVRTCRQGRDLARHHFAGAATG